MRVIRDFRDWLLWTTIGVLAFVALWGAVLLLMPFLATTLGFVTGVVVMALVVAALDIDF